jgi:hypothetical protein
MAGFVFTISRKIRLALYKENLELAGNHIVWENFGTGQNPAGFHILLSPAGFHIVIAYNDAVMLSFLTFLNNNIFNIS